MPELHKCETKNCKNQVKYKICSTCAKRKWRQKNIIKDAYNNLKSNARRRGKQFNLTYRQFLIFCRKTEYIAGKGRSKESYTIDRIKNEKGYTMQNIRVLIKSENSKKGVKRLNYDWQTKYAVVVDSFDNNENLIENPF